LSFHVFKKDRNTRTAYAMGNAQAHLLNLNRFSIGLSVFDRRLIYESKWEHVFDFDSVVKCSKGVRFGRFAQLRLNLVQGQVEVLLTLGPALTGRLI